MKSLTTWVLILFLIAIAGGVGFWLGHRSRGGDKDEADTGGKEGAEPKPVAAVSVVPVRKAAISNDIIAYGSIVAPTSEVQVVSVPFESRVVKTLVAPGEPVTAGQPLIEVEASAATTLALQDARNARDAAKRDLDLVQQRFGQKLATNSELFTAQNTLKSTQAHLQSLEKAGAEGRSQLKADAAGIVSKIDVQAGQAVPIGGALVEVASQNQIEAKLGVEPEDAGTLAAGQEVQLTPVENPSAEPVTGKIRMVGRLLDPTSRLIDVMVALPPDSKLMLDSFVAGKLSRASAEGLLIPREAVLPAEDNKLELFTVKDGKAVKQDVRLGTQTDEETQVISDDLKPGDLVVVSGNLELEDGMAVHAQMVAPQTQPAKESTPTTQPAETQSAATQPSACLVHSPSSELPRAGCGSPITVASSSLIGGAS